MSLLDSVTAEDHRNYLDAAARRSRTVGADAVASALDPTFLDAVDVVRAFPATAGLSGDVQNSLAQRVADVFRERLDEVHADLSETETALEKAENDRDANYELYRDRDTALAAHEQEIERLTGELEALRRVAR